MSRASTNKLIREKEELRAENAKLRAALEEVRRLANARAECSTILIATLAALEETK